jgi:hypothetical protein
MTARSISPALRVSIGVNSTPSDGATDWIAEHLWSQPRDQQQTLRSCASHSRAPRDVFRYFVGRWCQNAVPSRIVDARLTSPIKNGISAMDEITL